ncbi:hypothetical protein [Motilibacter deserti]|uniref:HEAT repeat domain-containing protein n=1 Tax=Motilibacter deserti TaxID=2714956 RepID=A0ABX0GVJ6_9ACTN|nr:hypothetical protein [Motilibacter deserti]NHC13664.1 hypothetical protein [Motilibacter deserti]
MSTTEPPAQLPDALPDDDHDALTAALSSIWLRRVVAFADYVGEGRQLTSKGNLRLADAQALATLLETGETLDRDFGGFTQKVRRAVELELVDLTHELALASGAVEVLRKRLVRSATLDSLLERPAEAWLELLTALLFDVGPVQHHWRDDRYGFGWHAEAADQALASLMTGLHAAGDRTELAAFVEGVWAELGETVDLSVLPPEEVREDRKGFVRDLLGGIQRLLEFGAVELDEDGHATVDEALAPLDDPTVAPRALRVRGSVALTPLGAWAMEQVEAGSPDALLTADPEELLAVAVHMPIEEGIQQIRDWVAAGEGGAGRLVDALLGMKAEHDLVRVTGALALSALDARHPDAVVAVERLGQHAGLRPFADVWRLKAGLYTLPPEGESPERLVQLLYAALLMEPFETLAPLISAVCAPLSVDEAVERIWRLRMSETERVLEGLAGSLTLPAEAKAARKALFKHRSLGLAQPE